MEYRIQERQVIIAILLLELVGALMGAVNQFRLESSAVAQGLNIGLIVAILVFLGLVWMNFNWKLIAQINLATLTGIVALTYIMASEPLIITALYAPIGLALLSTTWPGVAAVAAAMTVTLGLYGLRLDSSLNLVTELLKLGGVGLAVALGRFFFDYRERQLAGALDSAEVARTSAEAFAAQADERASTLQSQSEAQRQLLETIAALETPAIEVAEGVLLAPLIGHFDSKRADDLIRRLLATITTRHAQTVILDISGLSVIDTAVAQQLIQLARSVHLLGSKIVLSGISPEIATTLVQLDVHLGVHTAPNPRAALAELRAMR